MNWSTFFSQIVEHFVILALGVFGLQMVFMLVQWLMMRRAEYFWYLLYLLLVSMICINEVCGIQILQSFEEDEGLFGALLSGSYLSYWLFWMYLFDIRRAERWIYWVILVTIGIFLVAGGMDVLAIFLPDFHAASKQILNHLLVLPRLTSLYVFYYTLRYKDRPLAALMVTGALSGDLTSLITQIDFNKALSGLEPSGQTSFWFIASYILETLFFSAAIVYQTFRLYQRNQSLEAQLLNVKMAALRAQMNPHFIHNCLTAINRFILNHEEDAASHYLTRFSRLIRDILNHSRSEYIPLREEVETLRLYLEMEALRFSEKFNYEIVCEPDPLPEALLLPPLLVQPYVENAIYHGLLPKRGDRSVRVLFRVKECDIEIRITDNGVGRQKAAENKLMETQKQKSYGGQITEERLLLHNELTRTFCKVDTIDLFDPSVAGAGTEVVLTIPHIVETGSSST